MVICKNATEYQRELNNLIVEFYREIKPKERAIHSKYNDLIENATDENYREIFKKEENEIRTLYHNGVKKIDDFIKSQPEKPIYIFKANRRYYELKINWITGKEERSKNPIISLRLFQRRKPGWIVDYQFPHTAFNFVICPNCKQEFQRIYPHEKYCNICRRSPRSRRSLNNQSVIRYCQNPGCGKPIPAGKNKRTKYCCGACRTAAFEKRKEGIISSRPS